MQISEVVEGPVFLLLDPVVDHSRKDLPVALYETGERCTEPGRLPGGCGGERVLEGIP